MPPVTSLSELKSLRAFYAGRRVLVTGHTGFKGSWLTAWLARLRGEVAGLALAPDQGPDSLFDCAGVAMRCRSHIVDIRDATAVAEVFRATQPEIVFHLAARALVQHGYDDPLATIATNVQGTAHVLEAARTSPSVTTIVCVTTDKVYRNREWPWLYRETDELGGRDVYSASKAAAELIARTYREAMKPADRPFALVTARGGNVLGGGDWSQHRIVPDIVRALRSREPLRLRSPGAVRPWQHVLDLCYGYLLLGRLLADGERDLEALNFGPPAGEELSVEQLVRAFLAAWGCPKHPVEHVHSQQYEAITLRLDSALAMQRLGWRPRLGSTETVTWASRWYRAYVDAPVRAAALVEGDLDAYEALLGGKPE